MIAESQLSEPFTLEFLGSELPESIVARFTRRPAGNARFVVTVAPVQTEEQKLAALRHAIQEGIEDGDAGRVMDGASVFAALKASLPVT